MKIVVLSDTHIPRVAHDLPARVYKEIETADLVIHAGDFVEREIYEKLRTITTVTAVSGNMDSAELRRTLKEKEIVEAGRVRIGVIHGYGAPRELVETVRKEFTGVDAIVFGHSHAAFSAKKDGVLFFNPGSPTDTIFASARTFGVLDITDNTIEGRLITL